MHGLNVIGTISMDTRTLFLALKNLLFLRYGSSTISLLSRPRTVAWVVSFSFTAPWYFTFPLQSIGPLLWLVAPLLSLTCLVTMTGARRRTSRQRSVTRTELALNNAISPSLVVVLPSPPLSAIFDWYIMVTVTRASKTTWWASRLIMSAGSSTYMKGTIIGVIISVFRSTCSRFHHSRHGIESVIFHSYAYSILSTEPCRSMNFIYSCRICVPVCLKE